MELEEDAEIGQHINLFQHIFVEVRHASLQEGPMRNFLLFLKMENKIDFIFCSSNNEA